MAFPTRFLSLCRPILLSAIMKKSPNTSLSNISTTYSKHNKTLTSTTSSSFLQSSQKSNLHSRLSAELIQRISQLSALSNHLLILTRNLITKIEHQTLIILQKIARFKSSYTKIQRNLSKFVIENLEECNKILQSSLRCELPEEINCQSIYAFYNRQFVEIEMKVNLKDIKLAKAYIQRNYGLILESHTDIVNQMVLSQDGSCLITAGGGLGSDNSIRIWDVEKKLQLGVLEGHTQPVILLDLTKNNKCIVSVGIDRSFRLWSLNKKKAKFVAVEHREAITSLVTSHDSMLAATAGKDFMVVLWRLFEPVSCVALKGHKDEISKLLFTKKGKLLSFGKKRIIIWNSENSQQDGILKGHGSSISSVAEISDKNFIVTGHKDGVLQIWNMNTLQLDCRLKGQKRIRQMLVTNDNRFIITANDQRIILWEIELKTVFTVFEGHKDLIACIAVSSDSSFIASASNDKTIIKWSIPQKSLESTFQGHTDLIRCLLITNDNKYLISSSLDKSIIAWSLENDMKKARFPGHTDVITAIAICKQKQLIITGGKDCTLRIWNFEDQTESCVLKAHKRPISGICFSEDADFLYSAANENVVFVWNLKGMNKESEFKTLESGVKWISDYEKIQNELGNSFYY